MYKISDKVINFITEAMKNWKVELTAGGKTLAKVKIKSSIFQGDSLLPQFVMISLNYLGSALGATNLQNHKKRLIILCTWTTPSYLHKGLKKKTGDADANNKIWWEYRNGICHRKMCHAHNEKWEKKKKNIRNKTAKSGKN